MFWEYIRLSGLTGETVSGFEFIKGAGLLAGCGLLLALIGFKLKGAKGAVLALLIGTVLFLYSKSLLHLLH